MAIARLSGQDALGASVTTSVAATYPGVTTSGNLLICTALGNTNNPVTLSDAAFTVFTQKVNTNAATFILAFKIASGSETTITASNAGAASMKIHMYEYSGNANPIVLSVSPIGNGVGLNGGSAANTATINTVRNNDLIFGTVGTDGNATTPSFTSGLNNRQVDAATIRLLDGDLVSTSAQSGFKGVSNSITPDWSSLIAAFQASPGIATTTLNNYQSIKVGNGMSVSERIR